MSISIYAGDQSFGYSYSAFHRLRERLAAAIGIDLNKMEGFGALNYDKMEWAAGTKKWDGLKDPVVRLLNQPDSHGSLSPQECLQIKRRIWEVTFNWPPEEREWALWFATILAWCAFSGEGMGWGD